jgi:PHP family Zn ribbon phosphoesterase
MKLCDLHIHSSFSDGKLSIAEIVDFYGMKGFSIIAVTDHFCEETSFLGQAANYLEKTVTRKTLPEYFKTLEKESKRAWMKYGMLLLPGLEFTKNSLSFSRSSHILTIGIDQYISPDQPVEDLLIKLKANNYLTIAAHPVLTKKFEHQTLHLWDQRDYFSKYFDAWEVASGPYLFEEVLNSGLPMIASSDFHHPKHIRSWKSWIDCELDFCSLKQAINEQKLEFTFFETEKSFQHLAKISLNHSGSSKGRSCPAV